MKVVVPSPAAPAPQRDERAHVAYCLLALFLVAVSSCAIFSAVDENTPQAALGRLELTLQASAKQPTTTMVRGDGCVTRPRPRL